MATLISPPAVSVPPVTTISSSEQFTCSTEPLQRPMLEKKPPAEPLPWEQDEYTSLKRALNSKLSLNGAKGLHSHIVKIGWDQDTLLANHLISLYSKKSALTDAHAVFSGMRQRDVISWNAMVSGYAQHGHRQVVLQLIRDMEQQEGPKPDTLTFISALRAFSDPTALHEGEMIHAHIINCGLELDSFIGPTLVSMYGKCNALVPAYILFNKMQPCETVTWNAIMAAYSQQGYDRQTLQLYTEMQHQGLKPDNVTFVTAISACATLQSLSEGRVIHDRIRECGFESCITLCNALISMYSKCGEAEEAHRIFDSMPEHDVASWNAILSAYAEDVEDRKSLSLFEDMQQQDVKPDIVTFLTLLHGCASSASLEETEIVHASLICEGVEQDVTLGSALLNSYAKCGDHESAHLHFNKMQYHSLVSWNAMITMYAHLGHGKKALQIYHSLQQENMKPDEVTYISSLTACSSLGDLEEGRTLHTCIINSGCESDVVVGNALMSMYIKCAALEDACVCFNKRQEQSVVSWNVIIGGHAELGEGTKVLELFKQLIEQDVEPDEVTYINALSGCTNPADLADGRLIHTCTIRDGLRSVVLENSLLIMYGKCGTLEDTNVMFCKMQPCGIISWNGMMSTFIQRGCSKKALLCFTEMQQLQVIPNEVTFLNALSACASLEALNDGQAIHRFIIDHGLEDSIPVGTALLNMYGKCGAVDDARNVFDHMKDCDVITWNAMLSVYGQQGHGKEALSFFQEMQGKKVKPNDVTFINVLSACSHAGLVEEGQYYFSTMTDIHGIIPHVEHYGCMVDLFGRAGQLSQAEEFIVERCLQQYSLVWINLIGACRLYNDIDRGKRAAEHVFHLEPKDAGTYVLLSNMF